MSRTFHAVKKALFICLLFVAVFAAEECDETQCKGPITYYKEIKCKPVFENPGDCCAIRYDCSHLEGRSTEKCYINDREYAIGEELKDEDRNSPCDIGCVCVKGYNDVATFMCAVVDCFTGPTKPGCERRRNFNNCCPGEEICPENKKDVKCEYDGKVYGDNDQFYPSPDLGCVCSEGYEGKNVAPFCGKVVRTCGIELRHASEIQEKCIPAFYSTQDPRTSCNVFYRCPDANDTIIQSSEDVKSTSKEASSDDMMCKYGNRLMHVGDVVSPGEDYSSKCVKCVCEVPPIPTCQRLPDSECDITINKSIMNDATDIN